MQYHILELLGWDVFRRSIYNLKYMCLHDWGWKIQAHVKWAPVEAITSWLWRWMEGMCHTLHEILNRWRLQGVSEVAPYIRVSVESFAAYQARATTVTSPFVGVSMNLLPFSMPQQGAAAGDWLLGQHLQPISETPYLRPPRDPGVQKHTHFLPSLHHYV